jgi:probable HAF family extracellular repeat protein
VLINLGTVAGDSCSESDDINSHGQIVGESACNGGLAHAWLWEDCGPMIDLNTLIPPGSGIQLTHGVAINDAGEISGDGILPSGDNRAFILIPCDENHPDVEGCDYSLVDAATAAAQSAARPYVPSTTQNLSRSRGAIGTTCATCQRRANSQQGQHQETIRRKI